MGLRVAYNISIWTAFKIFHVYFSFSLFLLRGWGGVSSPSNAFSSSSSSSTASLQVPYLLSVALLVVNFVPGFEPAPRVLFRLLRKLDYAFASLLQGYDVETLEALPGFGTGWRVSNTEKVRLKSIVERTRLCVAEVVGVGAWEAEPEAGVDGDDDHHAARTIRGESEDAYGIEDVAAWDMEISGVYDKTIVELGDNLKGSPIGIIG